MPAPRVLVPAGTEAYVNALVAAGLDPVVAPILDPGAALDAVEGLVFTGGEDIDPSLFGELPHPRATPPNRRRDALEVKLTHLAQRRRMPTLALCRGIHIMNVALGGTLIQDIPSQWKSDTAHPRSSQPAQRVHRVDLDPDSRLARMIGASTLAVNSSHHQAIQRVADALRVTGESPDGIIEAVESVDTDWWMVGVQWHPEDLTATEEDWDRRIFAAFAEQIHSRQSS